RPARRSGGDHLRKNQRRSSAVGQRPKMFNLSMFAVLGCLHRLHNSHRRRDHGAGIRCRPRGIHSKGVIADVSRISP
ncbi:hypothetical protein PFISCL1PPCAC_2930, partial [Pristionchus fissidentatus]